MIKTDTLYDYDFAQIKLKQNRKRRSELKPSIFTKKSLVSLTKNSAVVFIESSVEITITTA